MVLGTWPTPLEAAPRLSAALGLRAEDLWIKRDDLTQLGGGGNKVRKLDVLEGIRAGVIPPPPTAVLLGFTPVEVSEGRVIFAVVPEEFRYNPIGVVHGGAAPSPRGPESEAIGLNRETRRRGWTRNGQVGRVADPSSR